MNAHRTLALSHLKVDSTLSEARTRLVDDVSLTLYRGEVVALVGASGSGKSMTCAAALDTLPPGVQKVGGDVRLDDTLATPAQLRGHAVASIMQNPRSAFNPVRSLNDHANESFRALGVPKRLWRERILEAMTSAGLEQPQTLLKRYPFELSGGMLQRMMIALALASGAPFLFADEPTTDLDVIVQRDILDLLERLKMSHGLGILLVTHDMGVVARLADRVLVMAQGRVIEEGEVEAIFHRPQQAVTRDLVAAHLSLYAQKEEL